MIMYVVKAIPKIPVIGLGFKPMCSWHRTKEKAKESAKYCRSRPGRFTSVRIEKEIWPDDI